MDYNAPVKKGQLIARIDPASFEAQVEQAKANLLSAKANLEKAEATRIDAQRTRDRNSKLFSENLIARSELDSAETNYETAKASVNAAKAQIAQTEAALKLVETNLRYTKIISPVDGVVISRNVDVGQTVAASFQTPTLFTIAQDLTRMQIDANVDESDIGNIIVGQDVEFVVDAYPDITFKGRVWQVRNAPITVQNVVTYDVVIQVDNPELKLKPGNDRECVRNRISKEGCFNDTECCSEVQTVREGGADIRKEGPRYLDIRKGSTQAHSRFSRHKRRKLYGTCLRRSQGRAGNNCRISC